MAKVLSEEKLLSLFNFNKDSEEKPKENTKKSQETNKQIISNYDIELRPRTSNTINSSKKERIIEFVKPVYDDSSLTTFRKNIFKKTSNFEIVWKNDTNSLAVYSVKTGSQILDINYDTRETFVGHECKYKVGEFKEALKRIDPLESVKEGGKIGFFYDQLHKFGTSITPNEIVKSHTSLILKNSFTALQLEDYDPIEIETYRQDFIDNYTENVSYYITHLANITYNEHIIKHAVKHINLDDVHSRAHYCELYKKLQVLTNTVTYVELEYADKHYKKIRKVLKELRKTYPAWHKRIETYVKRDIEKTMVSNLKIPSYPQLIINDGKIIRKQLKHTSTLVIKKTHLHRFNERHKWFGFKKNKMLKNLFDSCELNFEITKTITNLSDLKTTEDILLIYNALLEICAISHSRQIISFCHCIEVSNPSEFQKTLQQLNGIKNIGFLSNNNNLYFFDSLDDMRARGKKVITKMAQCLRKKFNYPCYNTMNYLVNSFNLDTSNTCFRQLL